MDVREDEWKGPGGREATPASCGNAVTFYHCAGSASGSVSPRRAITTTPGGVGRGRWLATEARHGGEAPWRGVWRRSEVDASPNRQARRWPKERRAGCRGEKKEPMATSGCRRVRAAGSWMTPMKAVAAARRWPWPAWMWPLIEATEALRWPPRKSWMPAVLERTTTSCRKHDSTLMRW